MSSSPATRPSPIVIQRLVKLDKESDETNKPPQPQFRYLSEEKMDLILHMVRRKLQKKKDSEQWERFQSERGLDGNGDITDLVDGVSPQKRNDVVVFRTTSTTSNRKPINIISHVDTSQENRKQIERRPNIKSQVVGQVRQPKHVSNQIPEWDSSISLPLSGHHKSIPPPRQRKRLHLRVSEKSIGRTKDVTPKFMQSTISQRQKVKSIETRPCQRSPSISQAIQVRTRWAAAPGKTIAAGNRPISAVRRNPDFLSEIGAMWRRMSEIEIEQSQLREKWKSFDQSEHDTCGIVTISNNAAEKGHSVLLHNASAERRDSANEAVMTIPIQSIENIIGNLENYSRYLDNRSRVAMGIGTSIKLFEKVAEGILDDCIAVVAKELSEIPDAMLDELCESEFTRDLNLVESGHVS